MLVWKKHLKPVSNKQAIEFWKQKKKENEARAKKLLTDRLTTKELFVKVKGKKVAIQTNFPKPIKNAPVYILIRTSRRPEFFKRCYESIKKQTYKNIVVIVHTDDPRNDYVCGDIIIKGQCYHPRSGSGTYNLYNNRLLDAIPDGWGWYHMIDDDDMYFNNKSIANMVKNAKPHAVNVARVKRWGTSVWPKNWRRQRSFQTECFFIHAAYKKLGRWWGNRGGDHYYSRQLTNKLPINWIEGVTICKAQEGKGHGKLLDIGKQAVDFENYYPDDKKVYMLVISEKISNIGKPGHLVKLPYKEAWRLDKKKQGRITFKGVEVCNEKKLEEQETPEAI